MHANGHTVLVAMNAGSGSGIANEEYKSAGAKITDSKSIFTRADMIIKVKEPLSVERSMMRPEHIIFTYFHFVSSRELT